MKFFKKSSLAYFFLAFLSMNAYAAKTTYSEDDFLRNFSGKSNSIILEKLSDNASRLTWKME